MSGDAVGDAPAGLASAAEAAGLREGELAAFADGLNGAGSTRMVLDIVLAAWAAAVPRLVGDARSAAALAAALESLAASGTVELPMRAWEQAGSVRLPKWVTVPAARRARRDRRWLTYPWGPRLGWVASLPSLADSQFEALCAVNDWLAAGGGDEPVVPARHRSVRVFGDEKRLDALAASALFGPGRLSFELLRCRRVPPPLAAAPVAGAVGADVLVVENADAYWLALGALEGLEATGPVRAVVWGGGGAFTASVAALEVDVAGDGPVTGTAWYWGDLDPAGLRIAATAAAATSVPLRPAAVLWAAMGAAPVQDAGSVVWSEDATGAAWLGPDLWSACAPVRAAGGRVAQEQLDVATVAGWAAGLG